MRRWIAAGVVLVVAVLLLIQLVPYRVHNPPVVQEPAWDSPQTEALARRACFDCHSNEVRTPWYGQIAPIAWLVRDHVDEGRVAVNFSEMNRTYEEAHESGEEVLEGEMPPLYYRVLHPEARLSDAESAALAAGLDRTLGGEGSVSQADRGGHDEHDEHDEHDDDD